MRFIDVLLALIVIMFSLAGATAIGADNERNHTSGNFAVELDGPDKGQVKSVEDGKATAEKAKKRQASPQKKSPQATTPPRPAVGTVQPLCTTPPCILKKEVDTKKK
ncbi:MAG: hypothetical protein ABI821_15215 [Pseudomonadota bacterium]